jgi:hypothetical protein
MISKEFEDHSQTEKLKKALLQIEDDTHSLLQDKSAAEERYCHCYTERWGVKRVEIEMKIFFRHKKN